MGPAPTRASLASDRNTIPGATFSDPTAITNPYAPYGEIERLVLEGAEEDPEGAAQLTDFE